MIFSWLDSLHVISPSLLTEYTFLFNTAICARRLNGKVHLHNAAVVLVITTVSFSLSFRYHWATPDFDRYGTDEIVERNLSRPSCPCHNRFVPLVGTASFAQGTQGLIVHDLFDHNDGKMAAFAQMCLLLSPS